LMNGIHCAFTGRLGSDPEQRYTTSGKPLLAIRVAVDETTVESEDRAAPETQWVRVITWEELALELAEKLHRGVAVYVEGRLKHDRWERDGQPRCGLSAWQVVPMGVGRKSAKGLD